MIRQQNEVYGTYRFGDVHRFEAGERTPCENIKSINGLDELKLAVTKMTGATR